MAARAFSNPAGPARAPSRRNRLRRQLAAGVGLAAFGLLVSGCAETELAVHAVKRIGSQIDGVTQARPTPEYKIGKPYLIGGVWYYPAENYHYAETGVASWYGTKFHGRKTANGEIYDMNGLTAAHRTLPLPSIVRVTNLRNGRAIKVRINDRGPFARGRIIDLSRRAAQLLGFRNQGTAPVRVEIMPEESRQIAALAQSRRVIQATAVPSGRVRVANLPFEGAPAGGETAPAAARGRAPFQMASLPGAVVTGAAEYPLLYVQAGAFIERARADRLRQRLSTIGRALVVEATFGAQRFYRVRIGPLGSVAEGDRVLDRVIGAGFPEARLVVD